MCFNAWSSLTTFLMGLFFSLLLISNPLSKSKYLSKELRVTGIFFIFISLIQLMDFLFWIDLKNKYNINHLMTLLGPILNVCQPLFLYIIKYIYYRPKMNNVTNIVVLLCNVLYLVYFVQMYKSFIFSNKNNNQPLITQTKYNHLQWKWLKYANPTFYLILLAINLFYLFPFNYASIVFIITYSCLIISAIYFKYNVGELWCFFGAFIPLIIWFLFNNKLII